MSGDSATPLQGTQPPFRVVHLVTSLAIGGLEKVVLDLVRCRTRDVFSAHVVCLEAAGVLAQGFAALDVSVEAIGTTSSVPLRILKLARLLRKLKPHILHTHNPSPLLHGALAARLAGVPVLVHTKHGRNFPNRRVRVATNRLAALFTDCVVAVSDDAARIAHDVERIPVDKVRLIHNGVDTDRFRYRGPRPHGDGFRAVTVARLDPVKDQATLLQAVRLVADRNPTFRLDIVGDGPSRAALESRRTELGLDRQVRFCGYQSDVEPYLAQADVFLLSSISEGIPLTLLEAMAVGLPGIATDVGGNREVIVPGVTGYLVPPRSPEALAEAMLSIQADPLAIERMGHASRQRIEAEFGLANVVAQYEAIYLEYLGRRGRGRTEWSS